MKSLKINYLYNVINQMISLFVPLILLPYISRVLGVYNIGVYSYALSITIIFSTIGRMGLNTYGQLQVASIRENKDALNKLFCELITLRLILSTITLIIYLITLQTTKYNQLFLILGILIISDFFDISWFYQGLEDFKSVALKNLLIKILNLIFILYIVKESDDLLIYAIIMQLSTLFSNLLLWIGLKKRGIVKRIVFRHLLCHFKFCIVYFIPTIANLIYNTLDKTMLGLLGKSTYENGCYEQAYKIISVAQYSILSIGMVSLPRLTYLFAKNEKNLLNEIITKTFDYINLIIYPLAVGILVTSEQIVYVLLGVGYDESVNILKILSVLMIFASYNYTIGNEIFIASKNQKVYNNGVLSGAVINIICNILFIPTFKSIGAAAGSLITEFIIFIFFFVSSFKIVTLNLKSILRRMFNKIIIALIMGIVLLIIKNHIQDTRQIFQLIFLFTLGICTYVVGLIVTKDRVFIDLYSKILKKD